MRGPKLFAPRKLLRLALPLPCMRCRHRFAHLFSTAAPCAESVSTFPPLDIIRALTAHRFATAAVLNFSCRKARPSEKMDILVPGAIPSEIIITDRDVPNLDLAQLYRSA